MSTKKISPLEILLWVLVILLILIALAPVATGYKVKSDYSVLVKQMSDIVQLDIQLVQYEQGLYSSDATLAINLPSVPEQIHFKEEIVHGPVYFGLLAQGKSPLVAAVVKGGVDISDNQQAMVQQIFAGNAPLTYQNIITFSGDVESQAYIPAVNTRFEDEFGPVSIYSSGALLNESFNAANQSLSGEVSIPAFKMQSALFNIDAQSLMISFSGSQGAHKLMIGDSVLSMGLLNVDSGEEQFAVKDVTIRSVSSENATLINSGIQFNAREVLASNQMFGPVKLNLSINGIDAQSLLQLQDLQIEMEQKLQQGLPPEQVNAMITGQVMELAPNLIKQAEIKVNPLSINSELGKLEADLDFMLEGIDANTPADPMFLMSAISLDVNVSIDELLLKQIISWELQNGLSAPVASTVSTEKQVSDNIQGMLDEQWLVNSEGIYMSKISMHQGELLINDKPLDLMQQMMGAGADGVVQ